LPEPSSVEGLGSDIGTIAESMMSRSMALASPTASDSRFSGVWISRAALPVSPERACRFNAGTSTSVRVLGWRVSLLTRLRF
jgi:hypothetical protein